MPAKPAIIGIAGISCSGKTTLARQLCQILPGAAILPLDAYYRDLGHLDPPARSQTNFDAPEALDYPLLLEHLQELARGAAVNRPLYSFATHTRQRATQRLEAAPFLLVEGLFALYWPQVRALYRLAVFVVAPHSVCLQRRLQRDVAERGRTPQSVRHQYQRHVQPMAEKYVLPTQAHADLVVDGREVGEAAAARIQILLA